jgi:hypothetical protein
MQRRGIEDFFDEQHNLMADAADLILKSSSDDEHEDNMQRGIQGRGGNAK